MKLLELFAVESLLNSQISGATKLLEPLFGGKKRKKKKKKRWCIFFGNKRLFF